MNIMQIMKQAQSLQAKVKVAQDDLANMEVTGESAGGIVKVVCNGQARFKSIKISPEAINSENPESVDSETIEMLEDLISSAINQASDKAADIMESKIKQATGGLNIPGLF